MDAEAAREQARRVLAEDRFRPGGDEPRPQPFKAALDWLGDRLEDVVDWLDLGLPGGSWVVWALLAGFVLIAAVLLTGRVTRRLQTTTAAARAAGDGQGGPDPAALEREASTAEGRGDHAAAVRLRYRAGLLRLAAAGRVRLRPSLTAGQARQQLGSERFDELSETFEQVAYGDRAAAPADAERAREGWPRVLREKERA